MMCRLTFLKLIAVLHIQFVLSTIYPNHNYDGFLGLKRTMRANFDTFKNEVMLKRHQELVQFIKDANDYPPDQVVSHENIVGTIPSNFISKVNYTSNVKAPVLNIEESEQQDVAVDPHKKIYDLNVASSSSVNVFDRPPSEYLKTHHVTSFLKPKVQRVKVHVFRGANKKYTILRKHKKQDKFYSHWGYFVSQPAGGDEPKVVVNKYLL